MAGSISLSLSQQFDSTGAPLNGGTLQFYAAGTTTPQSAYQDSSLTLAWPNPIILDSAGRIPPFYLADGQIKIVLKDAAGVTQVSADNLLVIGASSGSGTAPTVDATTILATGDFKLRYGTGALAGFVRANARTIGSATSGASERANADCEDLFLYLWTTDSTLTVSTGRGASAAADWAANKTIALPDWRGRVPVCMDDMGNSAAGVLTTTYFGNSPIVLGNPGGAESHTLTAAQMPVHTHAFTGIGHDHTFTYGTLTTDTGPGGATTYRLAGSGGSTQATSVIVAGGTNANAGSGSAHPIVMPARTLTMYLKL